MDVKELLRSLSKPHREGEKVEAIIDRTARLAELSYSRCYEIYYGRARRIEPEEIARIELALDKKTRKDARHELSELRLRIEILEARFAQTDPDFHREDINALRQGMRSAGLVPNRSR